MSEQNTGNREEGQPDSDLVVALRDCLVTAVILLDPNKQSVTLSGPAARILGLEFPQQAHCPLAALPAPVREVVGEILSSGQPLEGRQIELAHPGGQARKVRLSALWMEPGAGKAPVALIVSDLAPAMELERKLCQLERLANLGTLSASMAHESRNALVAVRTFTDLLLEKHLEAELAVLARREIERLDSIVSRMLKFSGSARSTASAVSLHEMLEHSLRLVQPRLDEKSITIKRLFQAAPALVQGEDVQLQQAFLNLFLNALDAMEPNGTLTVTTRSIGPCPATTARRTAAPPHKSSLRSRTPARASPRRISPACSNRFLRPSQTAPAWACRSPAGLSTSIKGKSPSRASPQRARPSRSFCRRRLSPDISHELPAGQRRRTSV